MQILKPCSIVLGDDLIKAAHFKRNRVDNTLCIVLTCLKRAKQEFIAVSNGVAKELKDTYSFNFNKPFYCPLEEL